MKKTIFVLLFSFFVLCVSQPTQGSNIRLGLKASPLVAWFKPDTDNYDPEGLRLGFSYGLKTEFQLAEHYSFATGINISYFGGKLSYPWIYENNTGVMERTYRLQNLEIPLTFKMKTREIGYNTYFGVFGIGNSVNLRSRSNDKFSSTNTTIERSDVDIKQDISFLRVALIVGLGFEHSLGGNTALTGGITFNNGFTNILRGSNPANNNRENNAKANYLEVSFGVLF